MNVFFEANQGKASLKLNYVSLDFLPLWWKLCPIQQQLCWGQKRGVLIFITDTLLNLSVLINHSFKVSSRDTLRKPIIPSWPIYKNGEAWYSPAAECLHRQMCLWSCAHRSVYVCVSETKRRGFCVATRKFIIFYLLKHGESRVKASHDVYIFHRRKILSEIWRLWFKSLEWR